MYGNYNKETAEKVQMKLEDIQDVYPEYLKSFYKSVFTIDRNPSIERALSFLMLKIIELEVRIDDLENGGALSE